MPPERRYPRVWVGLAKGVWPAEREGFAEPVEQREKEGLVKGEWPTDRGASGEEAWPVEMAGACPAGVCL